MTQQEESWEHKEPWVSILGVLYDIQGGKLTDMGECLKEIRSHLDIALSQQLDEAVERVKELPIYQEKHSDGAIGSPKLERQNVLSLLQQLKERYNQ